MPSTFTIDFGDRTRVYVAHEVVSPRSGGLWNETLSHLSFCAARTFANLEREDQLEVARQWDAWLKSGFAEFPVQVERSTGTMIPCARFVSAYDGDAGSYTRSTYGFGLNARGLDYYGPMATAMLLRHITRNWEHPEDLLRPVQRLCEFVLREPMDEAGHVDLATGCVAEALEVIRQRKASLSQDKAPPRSSAVPSKAILPAGRVKPRLAPIDLKTGWKGPVVVGLALALSLGVIWYLSAPRPSTLVPARQLQTAQPAPTPAEPHSPTGLPESAESMSPSKKTLPPKTAPISPQSAMSSPGSGDAGKTEGLKTREEAEQTQLKEEARLAELKRQEEEARQAEAARRKAEEERVAAMQREAEAQRQAVLTLELKRREEAEQARLKEEEKRMEELRKRREAEREEARVAELKRQEEEARQAEAARRKAEEERIAAIKRETEERKREAALAHKRAEEARQAEEQRLAEAKRQQAEKERQRLAELKRHEEARLQRPSPTPALERVVMGRDGALMVLVPAGEFLMGSETSGEDPPHRVSLGAFYMDRNEVTNAQYLRFVQATGHRPPQHDIDPRFDVWEGSKVSSGLTAQPVVNVDWHDAAAYCKWAGKRLPTEAEWEKTARGTDGRTYPWGNDPPSPARLNFARHWEGPATIDRVGSFQSGGSPYGAFDMAGNVWEWVSDWYDAGYYRTAPERNPRGPATGSAKVLRGGAWTSHADTVRVTHRHADDPDMRNSNVGFRCVREIPQ